MKKNNKKGFFLSETMVVIAIVAVVLLGVFKLFNSVYFSFMQSESYNTANAINALSNIQKYYESMGNIDTTLIGEDASFIELTNYEEYNSEYYDRLKQEFKIDGIYLMDLNKLYTSNDINNFYLSFRKYLNTLKNVQGIVLVVSLNENEYAYTQLENYQTVTLIGNKEDEFAVYIPIGGEFVEPGYKNWEGEEPTITWEKDLEVDTSKAGTYYKYYDFNGYLLRRKIVVANLVTDFVYTGDYQTYEAPYDGYYKVELWGASGGYGLENGALTTGTGGLGGYSTGILELSKNEQIYIYVGEKGDDGVVNVDAVGGYNGGGNSYWDTSDNESSGGGGGATDIRYFINTTPSTSDLVWNSQLGLNSRIIVAGGGGGGAWNKVGGAGGGLNGTIVTNSADSQGTQTTGYAFGSGGTGLFLTTTPGSGGGSGWYGGLGGQNNAYTGSGGSAFISGYAGVNAITSSTDRTHTNNTLHYSDKYFIDGEMQAGVNEGNGKAKITYLGSEYKNKNNKFNNVRYIKDCINGNSVNVYNNWLELQAISNGVNVAYGKNVSSTTAPNLDKDYYLPLEGLVDGNIMTSEYISIDASKQCVMVDLETTYNLDEIAVWHYYGGTRSYNNHSLYVSSDNTNWTTLIDNVSGVIETVNGIRVSAYD